MSNHLKTPLARSLVDVGKRLAADDEQLQGKSFPCTVTAVAGALVTVKFEVSSAPFTFPPVTVPIATSRYSQDPVQVGDQGYVVPADAYLGGVSQLGGGTADLVQRANLSNGVYHPLGKRSWTRRDPDSVEVTGVAGGGMNVQSGDGNTSLVVLSSGVTITVGGTTFTFTASDLTVTNGADVIANSVTLSTHVHSGVQAGAADTGRPVP